MYTPHTHCRACGYAKAVGAPGMKAAPSGERLTPVLRLGVHPLANDFCKELQERAGYAPLEVMFCPRCTLAQLSVVVKPEILYSNYHYVTSDSKTMRKHFDAIVADLISEQPPGPVVEIGSNNGLLLEHLANCGFGNLVGIEPANNLAQQAHLRGIMTLNSFFNDNSAEAAKSMCGEVSLIIARHCFCHVGDWQAFVKSLEILATKDTLIAIEVPYLLDQITHVSFDQVYHEHLSYLSVKAMAALLEGTKLHIHKVSKYPIHGGSILIMLRHNHSGKSCAESAIAFMEQEEITADTWLEFASEAQAQIYKLRMMVKELAASDKTVCGYGASAKSTVWLNSCNFTRNDISFITDTTPSKQHCMSPGTNIPVMDPGALLRELPDYCVIFAWNFADEILEKEKLFREKGGKFIIPIPTIKIV